jgi:hypothetical protein
METKIMSLKFRYGSKEEVPAELAGHYMEQNGAWLLNVEGAVERARLEEVRTNNAALTKEREELRKSLEAASAEAAAIKEKQALQTASNPGEVEKILEGRVKAVRGEMEKQLGQVAAERDSLNQRLMEIQIDQGILTSATKRGLRATALPDITARARSVFRLVNGVPTAFEKDGQTVRVGKDGYTPLTLEEWIDGQVTEAPHLFEANAGAGAGETPPRSTLRAGKNPFAKGTWNITEQMKMMRQDPGLAERMRAAAN